MNYINKRKSNQQSSYFRVKLKRIKSHVLDVILIVILNAILNVTLNILLNVILNVILNAEINGTWLEVMVFGIISPRKV